jgi:hypothetical protein
MRAERERFGDYACKYPAPKSRAYVENFGSIRDLCLSQGRYLTLSCGVTAFPALSSELSSFFLWNSGQLGSKAEYFSL